MTDYREIIRLNSLEFSNVSIANSLGCSRNTVSEVLKLAIGEKVDIRATEKSIEVFYNNNRIASHVRRAYTQVDLQ